MSTETPIYDQLAAESSWTPAQLRPPFDLGRLVSWSYERQEIRAHLRQQIAQRQRARRNRRQRARRLP